MSHAKKTKIESKKTENKSIEELKVEAARLNLEIERRTQVDKKVDSKRTIKTKSELLKDFGVLKEELPKDVVWHISNTFPLNVNKKITRTPRIKVICWNVNLKTRAVTYGCAIYRHESGQCIDPKQFDLEVLRLQISAGGRFLVRFYRGTPSLVIDSDTWNLTKTINKQGSLHILSMVDNGPMATYNMVRNQNAINLANWKKDLEFEFDDDRYSRMREKMIKLENECRIEEARLYKRAQKMLEHQATELTNHSMMNVAWQLVQKHSIGDSGEIPLKDLPKELSDAKAKYFG